MSQELPGLLRKCPVCKGTWRSCMCKDLPPEIEMALIVDHFGERQVAEWLGLVYIPGEPWRVRLGKGTDVV